MNGKYINTEIHRYIHIYAHTYTHRNTLAKADRGCDNCRSWLTKTCILNFVGKQSQTKVFLVTIYYDDETLN